jgi:hypothetical protein
MRALLHLGLFALALTAVSQASADDDSDYERGERVIVIRNQGQSRARPARDRFEPAPRVYESRRGRHQPPRAIHDPRRVYEHRARELAAARENLYDQERDLEQIVRIANRWEQASANNNPYALRKIERRLDDWMEREIIESRHDPRDRSYVHRLQKLRRELAANEGWYGHGRGHARGYGRGWRRNQAYKASILNELVELSERQVYRARARVRHPVRFSFAYR